MTVSGDFLGDLHHLADAMGVDWDEAQRRERSTTPPNCTARTKGNWRLEGSGRTCLAGSPRHRVRRGPALPHAVHTYP